MQLPHHVSPRSASFFGSWPLGIHPAPSPAWRCSIAMQAFGSLLTRDTLSRRERYSLGKYEKTLDTISLPSRAPHSAERLPARASEMGVASTSHYAVVHVRCALLPKTSGGDKTRPGETSDGFPKAPPEYNTPSSARQPLMPYIFRAAPMRWFWRSNHTIPRTSPPTPLLRGEGSQSIRAVATAASSNQHRLLTRRALS